MQRRVPQLAGFDEAIARRMATTVSCLDADGIAKVAGAGEIRDHEGQQVQLMHNGLLVQAGGYYGDWMAEIIRTLRGHHEPQEERVFHEIVSRLAGPGEPAAPVMIELGSFWTYYGLWFCHALPGSRVVAIEPDPNNLQVGRSNAALNGYSNRIDFVHGAIGDNPGEPMQLQTESDGQLREVMQYDLASLMLEQGLDRVELVLSDIQGAESILLRRAQGDLAAGKIRFMIISTHHHAISGNPLTHQDALAMVLAAGAYLISEHTVAESFSGDGLIAVSFDSRDADLAIPVSHARSRESLFGELEYDLATALGRAEEAEETAARVLAHARRMESELEAMTATRARLEAELTAITGTKVWRLAQRPRALYSMIRAR